MLFANYKNRILNIAYDNLITYFPMDELSGSTAIDHSSYHLDGTYISANLDGGKATDGRACPDFDYINDKIDFYSTGLESAFNGEEGSVMLWLNGDDWESKDSMGIFELQGNNNNYIGVRKSAHPFKYELKYIYKANNVQLVYNEPNTKTSNTWYHVAITWSYSNDRCKFFFNGELNDTQTSLGQWSTSGFFTSDVLIGAVFVNSYWDGKLAHFALWNMELTEAQIKALYKI